MPHLCHCVVTAGRAGCFGGTREVTMAHHISYLKNSFLLRDLNGPELRLISTWPISRTVSTILIPEAEQWGNIQYSRIPLQFSERTACMNWIFSEHLS